MDSTEAPTRILLVEDTRTQAMHLRQVLSGYGYDVTVVHKGADALKIIAEVDPAVVVSDIVMPGMDGYELCRQLRTLPEHDHIPVILMTSLSEPAEAINALAAGAANFLVKPVNSDMLHARIQQTLVTHGPDAEENTVEISFGGARHRLPADAKRMVAFLVSTFEDTVAKNDELKRTNRELRAALTTISKLESRYRGLIETSMEALLVLDSNGEVLFANPAAGELFEREAGTMEHEEAPFPLNGTELTIKRADGSIAHAEFRLTETSWAGRPALLASLWDVTENVALRERLRDLSLTDELTGLNNLRGFLTLAHQQLLVARRAVADTVLLFADMDGLKGINDTRGHSEGDKALVEIATLLRSLLRESDIIARVGGDEFAALLSGSSVEDTGKVVERVAELFAERNAARTTPWELHLSVGAVTIRPNTERSLEEIIAEADQRMYTVKTQKRAERN